MKYRLPVLFLALCLLAGSHVGATAQTDAETKLLRFPVQNVGYAEI